MRSDREEDRKKETFNTTIDSRFNQTLRNVQGLLKGRSFPGKVLITRRSDPLDNSSVRSPDNHGSLRDSEMGPSQQADGSFEDEVQSSSSASQAKSSTSNTEHTSNEVQKPSIGSRATDSARLMKFTKELSATTVILEKLRELSWNGIPSYLRPNIWRLLLIEGREF